MSKKLSIMSLSIEPELQERIKQEAKEEGVSASKFVRNLVQKYVVDREKVTVIEKSDDVLPVVLKIPHGMSVDDLQKWLQVRFGAIQKYYIEQSKC